MRWFNEMAQLVATCDEVEREQTTFESLRNDIGKVAGAVQRLTTLVAEVERTEPEEP
jgi:hypothetical protein